MASANSSRRVRAALQFPRLCPARILGCPTCQKGVSRVLRGTAKNWRQRLALGLVGTMAPAFFSVTAGPVEGSSITPHDLDFGSRKTESEMGKGRIKLTMLAVGLGVGGTEGQILEIASRLDRERFDVTVCALKGDDVIARELRARGVRVVTLNGSGKWDIRGLYRLFRFIHKEPPAVIHSLIFPTTRPARLAKKDNEWIT